MSRKQVNSISIEDLSTPHTDIQMESLSSQNTTLQMMESGSRSEPLLDLPDGGLSDLPRESSLQDYSGSSEVSEPEPVDRPELEQILPISCENYEIPLKYIYRLDNSRIVKLQEEQPIAQTDRDIAVMVLEYLTASPDMASRRLFLPYLPDMAKRALIIAVDVIKTSIDRKLIDG